MNYKNDVEALDDLHARYRELHTEISKVIYGQDQVVTQVLNTLFSRGHCLLIGVPGLAKTLLVISIAKVLGLKYNRIQFTPDLMPSDIIGTEILDKDRQFRFVPGPVFANIILADEINRTPPKTQSALLEAMQEQAVTSAGHHFILEQPFFVLATQNPIEQEGTYPLPEAQLDRFMFSVWLDYPKFADEITIVKKTTSTYHYDLHTVISGEEIQYFQDLIRKVPVNDNVVQYAVKLAARSRPFTELAAEVANQYLKWGAGPRASQYLVLGAKTHAVLNGKYAPDIEDVQAVAPSILRHRIIKNYKAEAENITVDEIIARLM
ncbi:MAG TPA: AAA family ATPase [Prolixibacteraceae bacterium]|jgi:MoxR-like ATPase|nr:AAA family ATPase [Prolixibacteraceae bacterium]HOR99896.1 AAA family ATPase [Prolixibacteraceae bacterium]HOS91098.1 AAA family ATPase [Prolixibacteraceae bacterium]HPL45076.1 AAA family ATPase [Prolixibacteraceae bacterium]HQE52935.1 AAA family ATPase [Prolixibacteraceae bacterium]